MNLRLANMDDLPQLKAIYHKIIENMNQNNIQIWDDVYPCEFFGDDIQHDRLYVLVEEEKIISAFALCDSNAGEASVTWESRQTKALYIDRLGVNVDYLRKGVGRVTLHQAIALARERHADYLRLFVVDINQPAINLYTKTGFKKADGVYDEVIDDNLVLHELGFEIETSM